MRRRLAAIGIGLAATALVLFLFFPQGCWEDDSGPGVPDNRRGQCPQSPARIGVLWQNGPTGVLGAVVLSQLVGWGLGAFAWRRLVPQRVARDSADLRW